MSELGTQVYDWGFFFEDGTKESLTLPFGPEHPDNIVSEFDGEWLTKVFEVYPFAKTVLKERPFAFAVVNPPENYDDLDDFEWPSDVLDWLENN